MASQSLSQLAVVGPTASGKTALGLELAKRLNGEIVSADSRQMCRLLDAGTAKPKGKWETAPEGDKIFLADGIPHHLIDILDPEERIDAARFASLAADAIRRIRERGKRPIVVGGTGLYLRALLEGLDPLPPRNDKVRERLAELAEANGRHWLHEELERVDPAAARRIPPNNLHRVVRALEVYELTGKPISSLWAGGTKKNSTADPARSGQTNAGTAGSGDDESDNRAEAEVKIRPFYVGIQWQRAALEERIRARCEAMLPGIIDEVKRLVPARYSGREPGFQSLGYPEALRCAAGETTPAQALNEMIRSTMAYAKRQATWFRRQTAVHWIDAGDGNPPAWADAALALERGESLP